MIANRFPTIPADPGRFSIFFAFQKNDIFCGVPIYTRKHVFQNMHLKLWLHDSFSFLFLKCSPPVTQSLIWCSTTISFNNRSHDFKLSINDFSGGLDGSVSPLFIKGELVLKKHFEHPKIDAKLVKQVFDEEVVPWCKENGLKLLIMDNESRFHTRMLVTHMKSKGIQIYPGSGKKPWDREENSYPPRSHHCMPDETEFAETFQDAQEDLERR